MPIPPPAYPPMSWAQFLAEREKARGQINQQSEWPMTCSRCGDKVPARSTFGVRDYDADLKYDLCFSCAGKLYAIATNDGMVGLAQPAYVRALNADKATAQWKIPNGVDDDGEY